MELTLKAIEVDGPDAWRWLLTDDVGNTLGDHTVRLDRSAGPAAALADLHRFVRHGSGDESAALDAFGSWLGRAVLGERIGRAIVSRRPGIVWVEAEPPVDPGPLELAHVDGVPLAARGDIALIFRAAGTAQAKQPIGAQLRMLAVFSQPTATTALALRHERFALSRSVRRLAATERKAVDLEVLQYGATRQELERKMWLRQGPDVLHISAHGTAGGLVLESETGGPDVVGTDDLVKLLRPGMGRLKLVVLSACESGAGLADAAAWAGVGGDPSGRDLAGVTSAGLDVGGLDVGPVRWAGTSLAHVIAREIGCAVLAMRFPVSDDYAIALAEEVYAGVFALELPVATAIARAVPRAAGSVPTPARPAISIAVPTLHGAATAEMQLVPPAAPANLDPAQTRMPRFPFEPETFVGRTAVLISAGRALSPGSRFTSVLIDGEAGVGKTACALELAYGRHDTFAAAAYWTAPEEDDFSDALADLARSLQEQLPGFGSSMTEAVRSVATLRAYLPQLTRLLADKGLLIVLDNLESLLTPGGRWRDPQWAGLIAAITRHGGESRVILTSRIQPVDLNRPDVCRHRLDPLTRIEALQLMRELPGLSGLLPARAGEHRSGPAGPDGDRARCRRVLDATHGIPLLIMQAEADLSAQTARNQWAAPAVPTRPVPQQQPAVPPAGPVTETADPWTQPLSPVTETPTPTLQAEVPYSWVDPPTDPPLRVPHQTQAGPPPTPTRPAPPQPGPAQSPFPQPPFPQPPFPQPPISANMQQPQPQPGGWPMPVAPLSPAGPPIAGARIEFVIATRVAAIAGLQVAPPPISRFKRGLLKAAGTPDLEWSIREAAGISEREQTLALGRLPAGAAVLLTDAALYWQDKALMSQVMALSYRTFPGRAFRAVASVAGGPPTHVDLGDGIPRSAGGAATNLVELLLALQAELGA